jgi:hypothetical protein
MAGEEGDGAAEETDRCRRSLVREHFGVGEAAVIVDGDVDVLPADRAACVAARVAPPGPVAAGDAAADALAGAALDPAELLDVDVHELTRAANAHSGPAARARSGRGRAGARSPNLRERHRERLGDLSSRHPQLPQRNDHRDPIIRRGGSRPDAAPTTGQPTRLAFGESGAPTYARSGRSRRRPASPRARCRAGRSNALPSPPGSAGTSSALIGLPTRRKSLCGSPHNGFYADRAVMWTGAGSVSVSAAWRRWGRRTRST